MGPVYWLERRRRFDRLARWLDIMTFAFIGATVLAGLFLYAWVKAQVGPDPGPELAARQSLLLYLMLLGGFGILLLVPMVWPVARALERRVGTDGALVYLKLGDGRVLQVAPERLAHTRQAILHGGHSFPLRNQKGKSFYREGEIESRLEPLPGLSEPLSPLQGLRHQWVNRDSLLLWPLAAAASLLLLLVLVALLLSRFPAP